MAAGHCVDKPENRVSSKSTKQLARQRTIAIIVSAAGEKCMAHSLGSSRLPGIENVHTNEGFTFKFGVFRAKSKTEYNESMSSKANHSEHSV